MDESQEYDEEFFDPEAGCSECGGEGWISGDTMYDPICYDPNKIYECRCCGGSGLAKDMTYF